MLTTDVQAEAEVGVGVAQPLTYVARQMFSLVNLNISLSNLNNDAFN